MPIGPAATVGLAPSLGSLTGSTTTNAQRPLEKVTTAAERGRAIVLSETETPGAGRRKTLDLSI